MGIIEDGAAVARPAPQRGFTKLCPMMRGRAGLVGLLLAAGLLAGACSSSDAPPGPGNGAAATAPGAPTSGTTPDGAATEPSPEQQGMDQLGELLDAEGRLPKEQALALWAARITPLEGVAPLPRDQVSEVPLDVIEGQAANWLAELPAGQQAVVQAVLDGQDLVTIDLDGGATTATTVRTDAGPMVAEPASLRVGMVTDDEIRLALVEARARFERLLGPVGLPLTFGTASMRTPDPDNCAAGAAPGSAECPWAFENTSTGAKTQSVTDPAGNVIGCRILANRDVLVPADGAEARRFLISALAHEMYHCRQRNIAGTSVAVAAIPLWVGEGTAAWVGEKAAEGSLYSQRGWWRRWLEEPERSLFTRSYDVVALLWLIDTDLGSPLIGRVDAVVRASIGGSVAAFTELDNAGGPNLWTRWATHLANLRGAGTDEWHPQGPYATSERAVAGRFGLPVDGGPVSLTITNARSAKVARIDLAGEVVEIQTPLATGTGLIDADGGRHTFAAGTTTRLCVNPGGCAPCPDGRSLRTDVDVAPGGAQLLVASLGGAVQLEAQSRDRACGPAPTTAPAAGSGDLGSPDEVCNRMLPRDEAEALLGSGVDTEHDYGTANDSINYPTYACRWRNGTKYLWATLRTEPDGARQYHGLDQFNVDNVFVPVSGLGSEARFMKPKPPLTGITNLDIVDRGNWLTIAAEGPIANDERLLARAGRTISDNWP